jgi:hypothetical protein
VPRGQVRLLRGLQRRRILRVGDLPRNDLRRSRRELRCRALRRRADALRHLRSEPDLRAAIVRKWFGSRVHCDRRGLGIVPECLHVFCVVLPERCVGSRLRATRVHSAAAILRRPPRCVRRAA